MTIENEEFEVTDMNNKILNVGDFVVFIPPRGKKPLVSSIIKIVNGLCILKYMGGTKKESSHLLKIKKMDQFLIDNQENALMHDAVVIKNPNKQQISIGIIRAVEPRNKYMVDIGSNLVRVLRKNLYRIRTVVC